MAHRLALARVRTHFRAVDRALSETRKPHLPGRQDDLHKQPLRDRDVPATELADRPALRKVACRQRREAMSASILRAIRRNEYAAVARACTSTFTIIPGSWGEFRRRRRAGKTRASRGRPQGHGRDTSNALREAIPEGQAEVAASGSENTDGTSCPSNTARRLNNMERIIDDMQSEGSAAEFSAAKPPGTACRFCDAVLAAQRCAAPSLQIAFGEGRGPNSPAPGLS